MGMGRSPSKVLGGVRGVLLGVVYCPILFSLGLDMYLMAI